MEREALIVATINDGLEAKYPGTDVPRTAAYAQVVFGQELDRRLRDQLPDWTTYQGLAGGDSSGIGIAIQDSGMFTIVSTRWEQMVTPYPTKQATEWRALVVRVDYLGCPLTLISAHRPVLMTRDTRTEFDDKLVALAKAERAAVRFPIIGIDANEPNPQDLAVRLGLTWVSPFDGYIVGLFVPSRITVLTVTNLRKMGEHAPVVAMLRVPILNAQAATS